MKIALFATCIGDVMFPQAPQATVHLLERLGCEVVFPESQACCSQMHVNTGYYPEAMPIIRNHVEAFRPVLDGEWDAIVAPSGSCVGSLRHQAEMVAEDQGDMRLAREAAALAKRTFDLPELLVNEMGVTDVGAYFPHRVTYHTTCHSLRVARVGDTPLRLLQAVDGIDYVPLPDADVCCGFGGTFSLKNPETSASMLSDKMKNILSTDAEVLVAGDYSCMMSIAGGLQRIRSGIRAMHLAEVLAGTKDQPWNAPATTTKVGI
ncbi:MAG: (Fe-S)-binding protein [Ancrocorticia populi]|uniref:(Fe-S)-binding protein n=2 Tax=Ancrocorticia populi TaxID=2175228 RepID=UPI003F922131